MQDDRISQSRDTELGALIRAEIVQRGPITIDRYMALCLGHPVHGYYIKQDPFGPEGDFTTAPEISQIFGDMVGLWCLNAWQDMGRPGEFLLVECGPGRGTLMADVLAIGAKDPAFVASVRPVLVETSPLLRRVQGETLADAPARPSWCENVDELPALPAIFVGNEFFDALPMRQFQFEEDRWFERMIGLDAEGRLCLGLLAADWFSPMPSFPDPQEGDVCEFAPVRENIMRRIATHIKTHDGAALFFDYGHLESGYGDTFQAVRDHNFCSIFDYPGDADLTSHVDFMALAEVAAECGLQPALGEQGAFLMACGAKIWTEKLKQNAPEGGGALDAQLHRLCGERSQDMGRLFKVLILPGD